jgi:hypothetical protein
MIIDDECCGSFDENYHIETTVIGQANNYNTLSSLAMRLQMEAEMTSGPMFSQLQLDLIEHVWNKHHT